MKWLLLVLFTAAALLGAAVAASAHVAVTQTEAPAGKRLNLTLEVGHGCDGAATTGLAVKVPEQAADFRAEPVPGWKASTSGRQMTWKGGPLPDHEAAEFPFAATLYGKKGERAVFPVIQTCEGGASTAWIQVADPGAPEPANPASAITLTSTENAPEPEPVVTGDPGPQPPVEAANEAAAEEGSEDGDDGSSPVLPIIGAVLIIASVTAFIVIQRGKRRGE